MILRAFRSLTIVVISHLLQEVTVAWLTVMRGLLRKLRGGGLDVEQLTRAGLLVFGWEQGTVVVHCDQGFTGCAAKWRAYKVILDSVVV